MTPHAKQVPGLHTKLKDLGDVLHPQMKDHKDNLSKHKDDTADAHKTLAQSIADLVKKLDAEAAARGGILDEVEQMNTLFRTKMRGLLNDEADKTKGALDDMKKALDDLRNKAKGLDEDLGKLRAITDDHKNGLDKAHNGVDKAHRDLDGKAKTLADLLKMIQDLKSALNDGLASEKEQRETLNVYVEELDDCLEKLRIDLGNRLLNAGVKRSLNVLVARTTSIKDNGRGK